MFVHFRPIGSEFVVRFASIFNVQIVQWPESIKLQVWLGITLLV